MAVKTVKLQCFRYILNRYALKATDKHFVSFCNNIVSCLFKVVIYSVSNQSFRPPPTFETLIPLRWCKRRNSKWNYQIAQVCLERTWASDPILMHSSIFLISVEKKYTCSWFSKSCLFNGGTKHDNYERNFVANYTIFWAGQVQKRIYMIEYLVNHSNVWNPISKYAKCVMCFT